MPSVNPTCYHLSASSLGAFKACPTRFRLSYREGLRPASDTDSQRQGTNWHAMHECYANALEEWVSPDFSQTSHPDGEAAYAMSKVIELLNEKYANVPQTKTPHEWKLEREVLLVSFIGYQWFFTNDPIEFLCSELPFNLPVHLPKIGMPLPMDEVQRVGKMDHVIRWQGMVGVLERKSTSRSIASDSDYWDKSRKDTQVSMYALAFRDMQDASKAGKMELPFAWGDNERYGNTLYDCWHKPSIKPKVLTQADTAAFLATGKYLDNQFDVNNYAQGEGLPNVVSVDGEAVEVEMGKKGFAIRESIGMFGARLLADIYERPDFYYHRREIPRSDADVRKFRGEVFSHYQNMKLVEKHNTWTENENQCRATFPCQFIPICYGPGADAVCDGKTTPAGFKRIFVDLTVNGVEVDE